MSESFAQSAPAGSSAIAELPPLDLAARLRSPVAAVDSLGLARQWRTETIEVTCRRPRDFEDYPALAERIRGGWGHALRRCSAADGRESRPFPLPDPFEVLFLDDDRSKIGRNSARPYVIDVDFSGNEIVTRLRLFGFAGCWLEIAQRSLLDALTHGIALHEGGQQDVPLSVTDCRIVRSEGLPVPDGIGAAILHIRTPINIRQGRHLMPDPVVISAAALRRAGDLACWHDLRLRAPWSELRGLCRRLDYNGTDLTPVSWQRCSMRSPGKPVPMRGVQGRVMLEGPLDPLLPFLRIGESAHIGGMTALGLGRYELSLLAN